jgi:hypothetical protein
MFSLSVSVKTGTMETVKEASETVQTERDRTDKGNRW